jgi:hypothetical protein
MFVNMGTRPNDERFSRAAEFTQAGAGARERATAG